MCNVSGKATRCAMRGTTAVAAVENDDARGRGAAAVDDPMWCTPSMLVDVVCVVWSGEPVCGRWCSANEYDESMMLVVWSSFVLPTQGSPVVCVGEVRAASTKAAQRRRRSETRRCCWRVAPAGVLRLQADRRGGSRGAVCEARLRDCMRAHGGWLRVDDGTCAADGVEEWLTCFRRVLV